MWQMTHVHARLHHSIGDGENGGGSPGNGEGSAIGCDGIGRSVSAPCGVHASAPSWASRPFVVSRQWVPHTFTAHEAIPAPWRPRLLTFGAAPRRPPRRTGSRTSDWPH